MNKILNRMMSVMLVVVMVLAMSVTAFAAEKKYSVDLNKVSDAEWENAAVTVTIDINGNTGGVLEGDDYMGRPVLLNIGKQWGGGEFTVTYIPIRLICEEIDDILDRPTYGGQFRVNIDWVNGTATEPGYAVLNTPKGEVKLYVGATSVEAADGTKYEETEYRFPDGSPLPLCLMRNNRIYVPVRFISSFIMPDARYYWHNNASHLNVYGEIDRKLGNVAKPWTSGLNPNIDAESGWLEFDYMPNMVKALEEAGGVTGDYGVAGVTLAEIKYTNLPNVACDTLTIRGGEAAVNAQAAGVARGIEFRNVLPNTDDGSTWKIIEATLLDAVKTEKDRKAIMNILNDYAVHFNDGRGPTGKTTAASKKWRSDQVGKKYELDEVTFMWTMEDPSGSGNLCFMVYNKGSVK